MNYTIILAGSGGDIPDVTLGIIEREPWCRPQLDQQLKYNGKVYTVTKCVPPSNPDNATVSYTIALLNNNYPYKP